MRAGSYVSLRDLDMTTKRAELSGYKSVVCSYGGILLNFVKKKILAHTTLCRDFYGIV